MLSEIAQTNLQLYRQMRAAKMTPQDIQLLQKDYETAVLLFAPLCRSTGRPFLCHAVGTASVALREKADFLDIRAALLHAAYKHGRFPDHKKGKSPDHTAWLTHRCGAELTQLLGDFSGFSFTLDDVDRYIASDTAPAGLTLRLIRLKLANDVDDSHDFGAALGHKIRYQDTHWLTGRKKLAEKLGFTFCAKSFDQSIKDLGDTDWLDTDTVFEKRGYIMSITRQIKAKIRGQAIADHLPF